MAKVATVSATWLVLVANITIPFAIFVFSLGFFPYKPLIPGLATFSEPSDALPRVFDKVIFMVVDALRSDFVYSNNSGFLFTQSLIRSGAAIPFTAYAGSPTVTMPRLKAITTGSVPSFLDVILNIAESDTSSTLAHQDTWLAQIKAQGGQIVLYGDDTWLKLFPGMFDRADGTTSFFVSDFTEVDTNVTRHIPNELIRDDWSALIMHYLGLDHIGHKAGPQSSYMIPKQREMDSMVSQVYRAMGQEAHLQSTLFVLCGDHGMNDAGNHGGSSAGETSPALLFISPKFQNLRGTNRQSPVGKDLPDDLQYYRVVDQTDITPTLAGLLGLPIPLNSLGVFIPEFLDMWPLASERLQLLLMNSKQLQRTLMHTYSSYSFDTPASAVTADCHSSSHAKARCAWARAQELLALRDDDEAGIEAALLQFLRASQDIMSSAASNYDLRYLILGTSLSAIAVSLSLPANYKALRQYKQPGLFLLVGILSYGVMMFASSYVEEEQQFWYWASTGWAVYLHIRTLQQARRSISSCRSLVTAVGATAALAISNRILRRWNQTGQKFAAEPDIARTYFSDHQGILWTLVMMTYADICIRLLQTSSAPSSPIWYLTCLAVTVVAFTFKLAFAASESPELVASNIAAAFRGLPLIPYARLVMCGIVLLWVTSSIKRPIRRILYPTSRINRSILADNNQEESVKSTVAHEALALLLLTQSRVVNIPIFLIFRLQFGILSSMELTSLECTVTSLFMQYATFFAFGGSNSISSIDLSNAYNGVGSYNVLLVGILTYVSNWAGPIWWVSASKQLLGSSVRPQDNKTQIPLLSFCVAFMLLSVMAACTLLRTHLFIWTVFSPKYLYTMAWTMHHFTVNILFATVLW
ncbi:GPI ethanolamine phosphate transferase 2 [Aspergillus heterothallicus]